MPEAHYTVALAAPAGDVWDFLTRPDAVASVTDPDAGVRLIDGPAVMAAGTANELEVTGFGLPQRVIYEVTAFAPPAGGGGGAFTETMTRGPMTRFENEHRVDPAGPAGDAAGDAAGGCVVTETFRFDPPSGLLGFVLTEARVRGELDSAMAYRHAALRDRFGAA